MIEKDSLVDDDKLNFQNIRTYFKDPITRPRSIYKILTDPLSDKMVIIFTRR